MLLEKQRLFRSITNQQAHRSFVSKKLQHLLQMDSPSKCFFRLQKNLANTHNMLSSQTPDGQTATCERQIAKTARDLYLQIFIGKTTQDKAVQELLDRGPTFVDSERERLNSPITTLQELHGLAARKAPGIDGLPVELYAAFRDRLGPCPWELMTESLQKGELPLSCRTAVVTLLPNKGDLRVNQNWRPVPLLCADHNMFSKVLANRLKMVLGQLIQPV